MFDLGNILGTIGDGVSKGIETIGIGVESISGGISKGIDTIEDVSSGFNIDIGGVVIEDVATKLGGLFGEVGEEIGKIIDENTKDKTFKF